MLADPTYLDLVHIDGRPHHRWTSGVVLPVLHGSADDDDDDDDDDERTSPVPSKPSERRAHKQAGKYRLRAKQRTAERDAAIQRAEEAEAREAALRVELAFLRTAADKFADPGAAWKLLDRSKVTVTDDGTVEGLDEAVQATLEAHPFAARADDAGEDDADGSTRPGDNPFRSRTSGRPMTRGKQLRPHGTTDAKLRTKYPALRNR
ncbi:MAG: hypothetical protein AB7L17_16915 [Ilumatobacteraceae bacterium]|jgi:hypothetical protein